jgi:hypothetical protein
MICRRPCLGRPGKAAGGPMGGVSGAAVFAPTATVPANRFGVQAHSCNGLNPKAKASCNAARGSRPTRTGWNGPPVAVGSCMPTRGLAARMGRSKEGSPTSRCSEHEKMVTDEQELMCVDKQLNFQGDCVRSIHKDHVKHSEGNGRLALWGCIPMSPSTWVYWDYSHIPE